MRKNVWLYRRTGARVWAAGFYTPDGEWESEPTDYADPRDAALRVHWLNGGECGQNCETSESAIGSAVLAEYADPHAVSEDELDIVDDDWLEPELV